MLIFARKTFDFFDLRCNLDEKNKIESFTIHRTPALEIKELSEKEKKLDKKYKKKNKKNKNTKKKKKVNSISSS